MKLFFVKLYRRIQKLFGITPKCTAKFEITKEEFNRLYNNEWITREAKRIEKNEDDIFLKELDIIFKRLEN